LRKGHVLYRTSLLGLVGLVPTTEAAKNSRGVPKGQLRVAQDTVLGEFRKLDSVPKGRLRVAQDTVLGEFRKLDSVPKGRLRVAQDTAWVSLKA
jgi:hypothetical protein